MMRSPCPSCLLIGWLVCWTGCVRSGRLSLLSSLSISSSIHSSSDSSPAESRVLRLTLTSRLRRRAWNTQTLVKHCVGRQTTAQTNYINDDRTFKGWVCDIRSWPWPGQDSEELCRQAPAHCVTSDRVNETLSCFHEQTERETQGEYKNNNNIKILLQMEKCSEWHRTWYFWKNCAVCITDNVR